MIRGFSDHAANERTFLAWVRTGLAVACVRVRNREVQSVYCHNGNCQLLGCWPSIGARKTGGAAWPLRWARVNSSWNGPGRDSCHALYPH
jgi:hypothetical protein